MNKLYSSLLLTAFALMANAAPRTAKQAIDVAQLFASKTLAGRVVEGSTNASLARTRVEKEVSAPYYIVNLDNEGYVVVSGDDRFKPVLGYSKNGHVDSEEDMPEALQYWLHSLSEEMSNAIANGYERPAKASASKYNVSIEPLLTSKWSQDSPFNKRIPNYATGCVATGVAQIMYYWKYPTHGIGSHTNGNNTAYTADFANTTYDWANMKDTYGGKYDTAAQIDAVATLMLHLGIATDMIWRSPQEGSSTGNIFAAHALVNFFGYNKNIHAEDRDFFSLEEWKDLLMEQLLAGRPIPYNGLCDEERTIGHFFVLDGYDASTDMFHFNWGWAGSFDGYYNISSLEPGTGGIGAGMGSYNYYQQMYVDVQPETIGEYVAHFDADEVTPSEMTAKKNRFAFNTMNMRHNSINFNGGFGMAIYSSDGTCKIVKSLTQYPVGYFPGSNVKGNLPLYFNLSELTDGDYTICMTAIHNEHEGTVYPIRALYGKPTYYKMQIKGDNVTFEGIDCSPNTSPVSVSSIVKDDADSPIYSITGYKVNGMTKGVYVKNRKKRVKL